VQCYLVGVSSWRRRGLVAPPRPHAVDDQPCIISRHPVLELRKPSAPCMQCVTTLHGVRHDPSRGPRILQALTAASSSRHSRSVAGYRVSQRRHTAHRPASRARVQPPDPTSPRHGSDITTSGSPTEMSPVFRAHASSRGTSYWNAEHRTPCMPHVARAHGHGTWRCNTVYRRPRIVCIPSCCGLRNLSRSCVSIGLRSGKPHMPM